MQTITTVGLDIAKSAFQVHGIDAAGQAVIRRQLKRRHASGLSRDRRLYFQDGVLVLGFASTSPTVGFRLGVSGGVIMLALDLL